MLSSLVTGLVGQSLMLASSVVMAPSGIFTRDSEGNLHSTTEPTRQEEPTAPTPIVNHHIETMDDQAHGAALYTGVPILINHMSSLCASVRIDSIDLKFARQCIAHLEQARLQLEDLVRYNKAYSGNEFDVSLRLLDLAIKRFSVKELRQGGSSLPELVAQARRHLPS